ncbi:MAG: ABC transporter permease [Thermoanaerobaculia bacterium]|nr:ABC transporter permease [Thermoanaerobaculia bacterium]
MFDLDNWSEIWAALSSNKLRTLVTAFGVFWGIFMLMLLLGSGKGLENGISAGFEGEAKNSFFIWTRRTTKPYRGLPAGRSFDMNNGDAEAVQHLVPEVAVVSPRNQLGGFRGGNNVTRDGKAGGFNVMGDYPQIRDVMSIPVPEGRFLDPFDIQDRRKVAVIGNRVQEILYEPGEEAIGSYLRINGVDFKVVGVTVPMQQGEDAQSEAETIYIPFTTFQRAFNYGDTVGWLTLTSQPEIRASVAQEKVLALLKDRHRVDPEDDRAFGSWNTEDEYLKVLGLFAGIRLLVWIVGIGTLAAGVIGVSNIMLIVVKERTPEIGLRRAIGATPFSITRQVLLEAMALTALAGYVGLLAGIGVIEAARVALLEAGQDLQMFQNPSVSLDDALLALAVLIVAGGLAGLIPARRAVGISPMEALRA